MRRNAVGQLFADPRSYQIAFLLAFLAIVVSRGDIALRPAYLPAIMATVVVTQLLAERVMGLGSRGPLSPLISGLSLCLLLRTDRLWVGVLAAFLAIASKFVLQVRGKHVFNPTNFGIAVVVLVTGQAWISPGQWGSGLLLAVGLAGLGLLVVGKVGRFDITASFLAAHLCCNLGRVLYLGESMAVLGHRLLSGSLIIFAFFMISDPRSTPDARSGRVLFAVLVAAVAYVLRFHYFLPTAPIWALLLVSPLTPLLDCLFARPRFDWAARGAVDVQRSASSLVLP